MTAKLETQNLGRKKIMTKSTKKGKALGAKKLEKKVPLSVGAPHALNR
jgi:hypothetical protein